ncbi:MAG: hypothetical protein B7Z67_13740 [Acidiphilium sp. 21-60-14]|nr:MAG: hypothetical protein B7Z67_13740 [Acidiphilium sp. 21-60-14]
MARLKLGAIDDDKPVKLTLELPATVHRDLIAYGEILGREGGKPAIQPAKLVGPMLVGPMLAQFMTSDRAFNQARRRTSSEPVQSISASCSEALAPD